MCRYAPRLLLGFAWLALAVGCASNAVILTPGAITMPDTGARAEGPASWSLWVRGSREGSGTQAPGQRVGTFYTRFEKQEQPAYLAENPEEYVAGQLSRYLLHRGLEASSEQAARVLLDVVVQRFSVEEKPGSVWDEITVLVAYTVHLSDRGGKELGRVTLEGKGNVKSPLDTKKQAEKALREALVDTFQALARSDAFLRVLRDLEG